MFYLPQEFVDKFGDIFSYRRNPRALIFQRDAHTVLNMDSLYKLMRFDIDEEENMNFFSSK